MFISPMGVIHGQTNHAPVLHPTVFAPTPGPQPKLSPAASPATNNAAYDEQIGETYTQGFTSILVNVTVIAQTDPNTGVGPAYLLNGLTAAGYWYQVGVSYNWPGGFGYVAGFNFNYEVWDTNGVSISPSGGGGGLQSFSGPVNSGDVVALNLYFDNGNVEMAAEDLNTTAYSSVSYGSLGATQFIGLGAPTNNNGYFTGPMTEWYHAAPYYGGEQSVPYIGAPISSAYLWADEWNFTTSTSSVLFDNYNYYSFSASPNTFQEFSANGAVSYADSQEFITGQSTPQVSMTFSYNVVGSANGYEPPVLTYTLDGSSQTTILSTTPTSYVMDKGTTWSVTETLVGSGQTIRWATDNQTSGDAANNGDVEMTYYAQENTIFKFGGALGSGYSSPSVTYEQFGVERTTGVNTYVWADIGSNYTFQQTLPGSTSSIRWVTATPSGVIRTSQVIAATYYEQAAVSLVAMENDTMLPIPVSYTSFGLVQTANTPLSTWMDFNTQYRLMLTNSTDIRYIFGGSEPLSGTVDGPLAMTYQIYPQVRLTISTFSYGTKIPITYQSLGQPAMTYSNTTIWADQYSAVNASRMVTVSPGVRLVATDNTTIRAVPGTYDMTFEKEVSVLFHINAPGPLTFKGVITTPHNSTSITFNTALWVLAGSRYNITSPVPFNDTQRILITPTAGLISSPTTVNLITQTQDLINETTSAGTLSTSAIRWVNNTQPISFTAKHIDGWQFSSWVGSVDSTNKTVTVQPAPGLKMTAVYDPGLTISASSGGSVDVSYGSSTVVVSAGQTSTIYVPSGTIVTLGTTPSNPFYKFSGWNGAISTGATPAFLKVLAPAAVAGVFGYDLVLIGMISAMTLTIIGLAAVMLRRGRQ